MQSSARVRGITFLYVHSIPTERHLLIYKPLKLYKFKRTDSDRETVLVTININGQMSTKQIQNREGITKYIFLRIPRQYKCCISQILFVVDAT